MQRIRKRKSVQQAYLKDVGRRLLNGNNEMCKRFKQHFEGSLNAREETILSSTARHSIREIFSSHRTISQETSQQKPIKTGSRKSGCISLDNLE